jgi:hypothetical protein
LNGIEPGTATECVVSISKLVGLEMINGGWKNLDNHPRQCNTIPMQATATSDILGLEFKELNYGLAFPKKVIDQLNMG